MAAQSHYLTRLILDLRRGDKERDMAKVSARGGVLENIEVPVAYRGALDPGRITLQLKLAIEVLADSNDEARAAEVSAYESAAEFRAALEASDDGCRYLADLLRTRLDAALIDDETVPVMLVDIVREASAAGQFAAAHNAARTLAQVRGQLGPSEKRDLGGRGAFEMIHPGPALEEK